jgi:cytochrome c553
MQEMAGELADKDIPRVADWFSRQTPPWPKAMMKSDDASGDATTDRVRLLVRKGSMAFRPA